ncbi:MAG: DUF624 domain-containing protein [Candidatus Izemoplasmatales bacterium]
MHQGAFKECYRQVMDHVLLNMIFLVCVLLGAGITFGAAFKSLHYVAYKLADKERHVAVFHDFWVAFKDDFFKSTLIWLAAVGTGFLLALSFYIAFTNHQLILMISVIVTGTILILFLLYLYPVMAIFQSGSLRALFRNSFLIFAKNPVVSFFMLGSLAAVVCLFILFEGTILVSIGLFAWLEARYLKPLFQPYIEALESETSVLNEEDIR